jgi:hypothetical protein
MRTSWIVVQSAISAGRLALITATVGLMATQLPRLAAAKECRADADCGADSSCAKACSTPGCATPPNCPEPTVTCAETGTCEPRYRSCAAAADCPAGLVCGPDPGAACWRSSTGETNCDEATKVCTFEQQTCTAEGECGTGFECATVGVAGCLTIFMPDGGACTSADINGCVPKQITCATDTNCAPGAVCFDFAQSRLGMPESWGPNAVKSCVSEGLAFALRGHAYFKGPGLSRHGASQPTGGSDLGAGSGGPSGETTDVPARSSGGGSACSLLLGSAPSWPTTAVAVALSVALGRMRRRRR